MDFDVLVRAMEGVEINEIHFQVGDKCEIALVPTSCTSDEIKGE